MSYNLYLIATLGPPRNHHALFLETHPSTRSGIILNVVGSIQTGMAFEERRSGDPEAGDAFVGKTLLGSVRAGNVERVRGDDILLDCRAIVQYTHALLNPNPELETSLRGACGAGEAV